MNFPYLSFLNNYFSSKPRWTTDILTYKYSNSEFSERESLNDRKSRPENWPFSLLRRGWVISQKNSQHTISMIKQGTMGKKKLIFMPFINWIVIEYNDVFLDFVLQHDQLTYIFHRSFILVTGHIHWRKSRICSFATCKRQGSAFRARRSGLETASRHMG